MERVESMMRSLTIRIAVVLRKGTKRRWEEEGEQTMRVALFEFRVYRPDLVLRDIVMYMKVFSLLRFERGVHFVDDHFIGATLHRQKLSLNTQPPECISTSNSLFWGENGELTASLYPWVK